MPAQPLERTRRLLDAALANGLISDDESRAVDRAMARISLEPRGLEAAFVALVGQLEGIRRDEHARKRALDRFFDHLGGAHGKTTAAEPAVLGGRTSMDAAGGATTGGATRPVLQWAGNLGRVIGPNAEYSRGVPEPTYFVKALAARDSMVLTAEAYVPGLTDHPAADLGSILAEVVTDLGAADGRARALQLVGATGGRRVNNNLRIHWNALPLVTRAVPGRYLYQFRFSVNGGEDWTSTPAQARHLIVVNEPHEVPAEAQVESSLLFKVGEVTPARIGWLGAATVRTSRDDPAQPLPAEVYVDARQSVDFLELAVQVWAPGVSNRANLTPEEHTLALMQLGVRVESPFFVGSNALALGFAGKAGIHEHDDVARLNLVQYLADTEARGVPPPPPGDYPFDVYAGDKKLGTLTLHWLRKG